MPKLRAYVIFHTIEILQQNCYSLQDHSLIVHTSLPRKLFFQCGKLGFKCMGVCQARGPGNRINLPLRGDHFLYELHV